MFLFPTTCTLLQCPNLHSFSNYLSFLYLLRFSLVQPFALLLSLFFPPYSHNNNTSYLLALSISYRSSYFSHISPPTFMVYALPTCLNYLVSHVSAYRYDLILVHGSYLKLFNFFSSTSIYDPDNGRHY